MVKVQRVEKTFWGNNNFLEEIEYSGEVPYYILSKSIPQDEVVPPHYAPTIEMLLCRGLRGHVTMSHRNIAVQGDCVIFIPPGVVHGTTFLGGKGHKICLTISPDAMNQYLNIDRLLAANGRSMDHLSPQYPCYGAVYRQVQKLINHDGDFVVCTGGILSIFETLLRQANVENTFAGLDATKNAQLQKLIKWTNKNIGRKIELEEAAGLMGFSKYYFCKYFKSITGMSYITFLQKVRVAHAEMLLRRGYSVSECCYACGYENISYFIQLFHRQTGKTMLQYQRESYEDG